MKTTFRTSYGHFEFLIMSFGLDEQGIVMVVFIDYILVYLLDVKEYEDSCILCCKH